MTSGVGVNVAPAPSWWGWSGERRTLCLADDRTGARACSRCTCARAATNYLTN